MRQAMRQIYGAKVFCDRSREGNSALCLIVEKNPSGASMASFSATTHKTCCFIWQDNGAVNVRCYRSGHCIDFCGHGLLAAAQVWKYLTATPSPAMSVDFINTGDQPVSAFWRGGKIWLSVPRIRTRQVELPRAIDQWFDPVPVAAAIAGGEKGYKIFVWSAGTDIAQVKINRNSLVDDERATILTQADPASLWSYTLRYLALQYDDAEDPATGSAAAVLADYWFEWGLPAPYVVLQRSVQGGVILSDIEADRALISGNVLIDTIGNIHAAKNFSTGTRTDRRRGGTVSPGAPSI